MCFICFMYINLRLYFGILFCANNVVLIISGVSVTAKPWDEIVRAEHKKTKNLMTSQKA